MALIDSLNAYWTLESNSNDSTANANNGTDTAITYGAQKVSNGASFNGTTSKIVLSNSASLKPTSAFTIAAWFKKNGNPATGAYILQNFSFDPNFSGYTFHVSSSGKIRFATHKNTGTTLHSDYEEVVGSTTITDNAQHLVIAGWDGAQLHVFVDNVEDAAAVSWANAPAYAGTTYPRIGVENESGTDNFFTALALDEVGLWSKALSPAERTQLWNVGNGTTYPFPERGGLLLSDI